MGHNKSTDKECAFYTDQDGLPIDDFCHFVQRSDSQLVWNSIGDYIRQGSKIYIPLLERFQVAMGMELMFSTAFHPQTNGQTEWTIQILEDLLQASMLDFGDIWEEHLHLVEFAYNNSYQANIEIVPFEALYARPC